MNSMKLFLETIVVVATLILGGISFTQDDWQNLTPNHLFEGWEIKNGYAPYRLENEVVIGTTIQNSPNTFLCTKQHFDDFILEFEVLVDSTINSGVQFRSNSLPEFNEGQVHGYQAEIDPSSRAWSGGIYDEGRRGWLFDLKNNAQGRKAFKNGVWNHYRIEAIGNHLAIWVNGINTANLMDNKTSSGFIGLQVHSIGNSQEDGKEIKWRKLRILTENLEANRTKTTIQLKKV